jgi:uncharacterized protein (DUF2141 family)
MRAVPALLASSLIASAALAQQPRDGVRPRLTGAGRIWGVVTSDTAEPKPLRRARVTLSGGELIVGRTTLTDDGGSFSFEGLPAGRYTVGAMKDAYVPVNFGAKRPGRLGAPVTIRGDEQRRVTIALPRGAVITGVITDPEGQPAAGIGVTALTWRYLGAIGERRLVPAATSVAPTDDRGVYRIFGLPAGEYLIVAQRFGARPGQDDLQILSSAEVKRAIADVAATASRPLARTPGPTAVATAPAAAAPVDPPRRVGFAQIFYPGTPAMAQAKRISVAAAEERAAVDFQLDYVPTAAVQGIVVGGGDSASAEVMLTHSDPTVPGETAVRRTRALADGRFSFNGIPPGDYTVTARFTPYPRRDATSMPPTQWATTDVAVNGQDIPDLVLTPQPGFTIQGRIEFEGTTSRPRLPERRLSLPLALYPSGVFVPSVQSEPDGRFLVDSLPPGHFIATAVPGIRIPLGSWWLKSAMLNGHDILDEPLQVRQSEANLVVTFSDRASELTGTVAGSLGQPVAGVVIAFSTDRRGWFYNSRRIAAARADAHGRYSLRNLPPGSYFVVQTDELEYNEWFDPTVLETLTRDAARITLAEYETKAHDIKVAVR